MNHPRLYVYQTIEEIQAEKLNRQVKKQQQSEEMMKTIDIFINVVAWIIAAVVGIVAVPAFLTAIVGN